MSAPQPDLFEGPFLPDVAKAAGLSVPLGMIGGFFLGGLYSAVGSADPVRWGSYGAGLVGVFAVSVVFFSRLWT